jgi:hypothetical protein
MIICLGPASKTFHDLETLNDRLYSLVPLGIANVVVIFLHDNLQAHHAQVDFEIFGRISVG